MTLFAKKTGGEICVSTEKDVDDAYVTLQTVSLSEIMNVKIFHFILLIYVLTLIFFFFFLFDLFWLDILFYFNLFHILFDVYWFDF